MQINAMKIHRAEDSPLTTREVEAGFAWEAGVEKNEA